MSSKKGSKHDVDSVLDEFKTTKPVASNFLSIIVAFAVSCLPIYMYSTLFDLSIKDYAIHYIVMVVASTVLLTMAYANISQGAFAKLSFARKSISIDYKKIGVRKEEADAKQEELSQHQATVWAFFVANVVYFLGFFLMAFYVLRNLHLAYNALFSVILPAAGAWQLSTTMTVK